MKNFCVAYVICVSSMMYSMDFNKQDKQEVLKSSSSSISASSSPTLSHGRLGNLSNSRNGSPSSKIKIINSHELSAAPGKEKKGSSRSRNNSEEIPVSKEIPLEILVNSQKQPRRDSLEKLVQLKESPRKNSLDKIKSMSLGSLAFITEENIAKKVPQVLNDPTVDLKNALTEGLAKLAVIESLENSGDNKSS